jgi:hypothetical protein
MRRGPRQRILSGGEPRPSGHGGCPSGAGLDTFARVFAVQFAKSTEASARAPRPFRIGGGRWGLAVIVVPPMLLSILAVWKGEPGTVAQGLAAIAVGPLVYLVVRAARGRSGGHPAPEAGTPAAEGGEPAHYRDRIGLS